MTFFFVDAYKFKNKTTIHPLQLNVLKNCDVENIDSY